MASLKITLQEIAASITEGVNGDTSEAARMRKSTRRGMEMLP